MVSSISFFIAGHQDDALLFRGEFLQTDVNTPGARVVHIVTTAGDNGWQPSWWQAREAGLVAAHNRAQAPDQYPTAVRKKFHKNVTVYDTPGGRATSCACPTATSGARGSRAPGTSAWCGCATTRIGG
ncbi:hypothetical protein [Saccharopolyspora sp. CA-218241]|uniref:hypothetical protein n=1 Tax=Saccharopolyspora sp. CA-218241 TaxID=3240027 RepID=UPI003D9578E2